MLLLKVRLWLSSLLGLQREWLFLLALTYFFFFYGWVLLKDIVWYLKWYNKYVMRV